MGDLGPTWGHLEDARQLCGQSYQGTFPSVGLPGCFWMTCCPPPLMLDYVYVASKSSLRCVSVIVPQQSDGELDLRASDHLPITSNFEALHEVEKKPDCD